MSEPLISVLIPAYNHENYIQNTIQSAIDQTYQNIELLVFDDGSKDSTFEKMKELEEACKKRFSNFRLMTKENEGICKTLNRLLELASGEYILICASDDCLKPDVIEKEYGFLSKNPDYALCVGNNEFIDENSKVRQVDENQNAADNNKAKYKTFKDYLQASTKINFNSDKFGTYETLYIRNYIPNGYLIRKSIFKKTGLYREEAPLEDWYLMLQISKYAKMKFIDEVLFSYRIHPSNTIKNTKRMLEIYRKTEAFENEVVLPNLDFNSVPNEIKNVYREGALLKRQGLPFVFEILTHRRYKERIKEIKLFNLTICKYTKREKHAI